MNKKLFLAGVALLAAVGFTSCNSETPIDPSTPSGIAPTTVGHRVGVDYDWAVKAKDVAQYDEYWAADKDAVQALVKDKKTATICFIADDFTLEDPATGVIYIPELWADANGKVVNVRIAGTFKNPDYLRADWMKAHYGGAKQTKFPVQINTKNVKGAEVNFTFDGGEFDLELTTPLTRSTLNGPYSIGYLMAKAANYMSSVEIQSGDVVAIDIASTGDLKEKEDAFVTGVWTDGKKNVDVVAEKGIFVGDSKYIRVENVFVEDDALINNLGYNKDAKKTYQLGTVRIVNPYKNVTATFASDDIYALSVEGAKADKNFITVDDIDITLDYIDAIENVTVKGDTYLINDVCTNVIFKDEAKFDTEIIDAFDEVTFNDLTVFIHADDVTVSFDKVFFNKKPVLSSTLEYEATDAYTTYETYQWIISDTHPKNGYYKKCKNDLSDLTEYNKTKEVKEFTNKELQYDDDPLSSTYQFFKGKKAADAEKCDVVVISTYHPAGTYTLTPNGTVVDLDGTCRFLKGAGGYDTVLAALNNIWGYKEFKDEGAWYTVVFDDTEYIWRKLNNSKLYVLVLE